MLLQDRIITYILKKQTTTLIELEGLVLDNQYTLDELFTALETVHRDKRITNTANASGEITYRVASKKKSATPGTDWLRDHYPKMDSTNDGSGLEADYSYLFLTPDELKQYKADARGVPAFMYNKKRNGHPRR